MRRIIYLSSASVHGQAPAPGTDEKSLLNPRQRLAYNNAKVRAEEILQQLRAQGNVEVVILRPGIVYGPRSSWVTDFADALLAGSAYLINRGKGICNSLFVDNLAGAILQAIHAAAVDGHCFLLRDKECMTWADFYRPIAEALGYNVEDLPEADLPRLNPFWELAKQLHKTGPVQAALSIFPVRWRQSVYEMMMSSMNRHDSPWMLPATPRLIATAEMATLYQCEYALPYDKATRLLGYEPSISFCEASCRTIHWLRFAGYPTIERTPLPADQEAAWA